jgi:hypothetical protein
MRSWLHGFIGKEQHVSVFFFEGMKEPSLLSSVRLCLTTSQPMNPESQIFDLADCQLMYCTVFNWLLRRHQELHNLQKFALASYRRISTCSSRLDSRWKFQPKPKLGSRAVSAPAITNSFIGPQKQPRLAQLRNHQSPDIPQTAIQERAMSQHPEAV